MSDNTKNDTKPEASAEVQLLSEKLAPHFTAAEGGKGITVAKDAYEATLPAGITPELRRQVAQHDAEFYPAVIHAASPIADVLFAKDEDLNEFDIKVPMSGRGNFFQATFERKAEVVNPRDRSEVRTVYGQVTPKLVTAASKSGSAQMKTVRDIASERARAAYGKDD